MNPIILDKVRGSLLGGAVGDALGYPVMNDTYSDICDKYGTDGIQEYVLEDGKAKISESTQLALFTANGLLRGKTIACRTGEDGPDVDSVCQAYRDWVKTQESDNLNESHTTWLYNIESLHSRRLLTEKSIDTFKGEYGSVDNPITLGKDFGAIVRIAPIGLYLKEENMPIENIDKFAANVAACSHGYDAAYISAAILAHTINKLTYTEMTVKEAVKDAMSTIKKLCGYKPHVERVMEGLHLALSLTKENKSDQDAISEIGVGNSADEILAAAVFFSVKYAEDFEGAIHAAVNNDGNSCAIASVTGNILGAYLGARDIPENYLEKLELRHIIQIIAEDLHEDCPNTNYFDNFNWIWEEKYGEACYII